MSELLFGDLSVEAEDIKRVDGQARLAGRIALAPTPVDPIEPNLLNALIPQISGPRESLGGGVLRPPLAYVFAAQRNKTFPDGIALRKMEGALDKQLRNLAPSDYPMNAAEPDFFRESKIMDEVDGEELFWDMNQPLRYNDPNAYKITTALMNVLSAGADEPKTVVDIGVAFGEGTKKTKFYDKWPFIPTQAMILPARGGRINPDLPPDSEIQRIIDAALDQEPTFGRVVGTDLYPPTAGDLELGSSETFLMSRRIRKPEAVQEFYEIFQEDPSQKDIWFPKIHTDATVASDVAKLSDTGLLPDGKADIFVFSGVVLQFPPDRLKDTFKNFQSIANPGACAIVNEWGYTGKDGLKMYKGAHWQHNGGFKTFIIDIWNPDRPPVEICRYTNRQCEKMGFTKTGRQVMKTGRLPWDQSA